MDHLGQPLPGWWSNRGGWGYQQNFQRFGQWFIDELNSHFMVSVVLALVVSALFTSVFRRYFFFGILQKPFAGTSRTDIYKAIIQCGEKKGTAPGMAQYESKA
ncbi:hypothetical protein [Endozoicomonas sp. SCSIO W0465]|uniref:hypothetical protein n=1 Tax=Endozoicomonas sp. SCSIO W0465 TaxID=2918516 RepID=UPI0020755831|nr:hypothetical protein [Endozoicomonas sp. SCSIO W0465]USE37146.1 hypothetical protein MJO57_02630 [Endozoicomonas sp. SCSIO W0465]